MAVLFNAHADRLYNGSLPVANTAYTVCMWVKPHSGGGQHEFFFESDAAGTTYVLASNNGVLGILNAGGGFTYDVTLGSAMTDDVWYFIAMTINGTTGNLYRGTESSACTNASGTIASQASSYRVYIGSDGSSSSYPCVADIAHVRIWDAVLSGSEIEAERQSATPVRTSNISADWRMVDAAGKLTDSSGQSHPLVASSTGPWADASDPSFGTTVTGTSAVTQGNATSAATGIFGPQGTSAVTQGAATSAAAGSFVGGVTFNSSSDRAEALGLPLDTTSFTLAMWVKAHTANSGTVNWPMYCTGTTVPILRFNGSDVPELTDSASTYSITIGSAISLDVWYFLAISVNGTTGKIYRGTESTAVTNNSGTVASFTAADMYLMYGTSNFNSDGALIRLWDAVLSDAEVEAERASKTPVRTANLTADWRMVNEAGKATDSSGNGYTLGYVGGSWSSVAGPNPQVVVTGTSAVTQGNATSAASGLLVPSGTSAVTQDNATSSAAGTHSIAGTSSVTQSDATSSASGTHSIAGASSVTQGEATSAASGLLVPVGVSAVTQDDATSSAVGAHGVAGTSSVAQGDATSSAEGACGLAGTSAVTQGDATSSSTGVHGVAGTASSAQDNAASTATGLLVPVGTSSVTQSDSTSASTGAHGVAGTASSIQSDATSIASGLLVPVGTSVVTQGDATSAASGTVGTSVSGTSVVTQGDATSVASGTVFPAGVSIVTQGNATSAASGIVIPLYMLPGNLAAGHAHRSKPPKQGSPNITRLGGRTRWR